MNVVLSILSILMLEFNFFGQVDTVFWTNGNIREIHAYSSVDSYAVQAYHSNGTYHFKGKVELYSNLDYKPNIEEAFDIKGNPTIVDGEGVFYSYYQDLKLQSKSHFMDHRLLDDYEEYFQNGQLKIKGNYGGSDGIYANYKQGVWQFYNEKGILCEERKYVNGNEYYLNFWLDGKQILKDGNGKLKLYYDSGKLKAEGSIKDGKKWGKWIEYAPNSSVLNKLKYTEWSGNHKSEIAFKMKLLKSFDLNQYSIGNKGFGHMLVFRNNGTLEMKNHLKSDSLDSMITYYPHGIIFRKISVTKWSKTTIETFYPNQRVAFRRVNENESHYWNWDGTLNCEIRRSDFIQVPNSYKETTIKYYSNGNKKEVKECQITFVMNEFGEELFQEDCQSNYWDLQGNEIKEP